MKRKYLKKISDYAIAGGLGALVIAGLSGCDQKDGNEAAFTQASQIKGAFVVIEEVSEGKYKIVDEYPSNETRVILKSLDGTEKILSQEELDTFVKEEAKRIENGTSNLTQPSIHGGGMSLGETILASAAGAIIGSWIGSKLFNNPNYQNNRKANYKSPSAYNRSINSFNKAKRSSTKTATRSKRSGFFSRGFGSRSKTTFGS